MKNKKFPDNVVYDDKDGFTANIKPYGTNVGAPAIKPDDVDTWKSIGVTKVNKQFLSKFNELKKEYQNLIEEFKWNELVYKSRFHFEPVIGHTYHLYFGDDGDLFLSLIAPHEWKRDHVGSFTLNSERKFIKNEKM